MALPSTRRTTSLSGSARLGLSGGKTGQNSALAGIGAGSGGGRHPLRHDWSISYVHRPPGAKVDYEKEIRKVATFGSIESFLQLYSHLIPPSDLPPVTDVLVFLSRIGRPGVWEEMRDGGKFTLRLAHPVTPILYESLLLALIGDQFDESDAAVGIVLSVRQGEDILSLWVEEEGESVRSGALKEKIISLLSLPPNTMCEYRSNKALLDAASTIKTQTQSGGDRGDKEDGEHRHQHQHQHQQHNHNHNHNHHGQHGHGPHHGQGRYNDRSQRQAGEEGEREWIERPEKGDRGDRGDRGERGERGERTDRGERGERGDRSSRVWNNPPSGTNGFRERGGYGRSTEHQNTSTAVPAGEKNAWEGRNGWSSRRAPGPSSDQ